MSFSLLAALDKEYDEADDKDDAADDAYDDPSHCHSHHYHQRLYILLHLTCTKSSETSLYFTELLLFYF